MTTSQPTKGDTDELREKLDILFNPIQAEYDNDAPMMPGDIPRIKKEIFEEVEAYASQREIEAKIEILEAQIVAWGQVNNPFVAALIADNKAKIAELKKQKEEQPYVR